MEQHADLERVSTATTAKLEELARVIQQRREYGFAAAQAVVATNIGKRTMDGIRLIMARMEAREDNLVLVAHPVELADVPLD